MIINTVAASIFRIGARISRKPNPPTRRSNIHSITTACTEKLTLVPTAIPAKVASEGKP